MEGNQLVVFALPMVALVVAQQTPRKRRRVPYLRLSLSLEMMDYDAVVGLLRYVDNIRAQ